MTRAGTTTGKAGFGAGRHSLLAVVVGAGALLFPAAPVGTGQTCPPGQVEDTQTPGFQCVWDCPPGTLMDGVTGACVAAPGVPPPPLP